MSQSTIDLLKVLAAAVLVFAVTSVIMLFLVQFYGQYGRVGGLPLQAPGDLLPLLANNRLLVTLGGVMVTATGIALLATSQTIDMALLITAKAVTVVVAALLGVVVGFQLYLQLTGKANITLDSLIPTAIVLALFFVLSSVASVPNLRSLGNLRFLVAIVLILGGPLLLGLL